MGPDVSTLNNGPPGCNSSWATYRVFFCFFCFAFQNIVAWKIQSQRSSFFFSFVFLCGRYSGRSLIRVQYMSWGWPTMLNYFYWMNRDPIFQRRDSSKISIFGENVPPNCHLFFLGSREALQMKKSARGKIIQCYREVQICYSQVELSSFTQRWRLPAVWQKQREVDLMQSHALPPCSSTWGRGPKDLHLYWALNSQVGTVWLLVSCKGGFVMNRIKLWIKALSPALSFAAKLALRFFTVGDDCWRVSMANSEAASC